MNGRDKQSRDRARWGIGPREAGEVGGRCATGTNRDRTGSVGPGSPGRSERGGALHPRRVLGGSGVGAAVLGHEQDALAGEGGLMRRGVPQGRALRELTGGLVAERGIREATWSSDGLPGSLATRMVRAAKTAAGSVLGMRVSPSGSTGGRRRSASTGVAPPCSRAVDKSTALSSVFEGLYPSPRLAEPDRGPTPRMGAPAPSRFGDTSFSVGRNRTNRPRRAAKVPRQRAFAPPADRARAGSAGLLPPPPRPDPWSARPPPGRRL